MCPTRSLMFCPVAFSESDLPREAAKPAEKGKHSPTAHWAAFTFSGVPPSKESERDGAGSVDQSARQGCWLLLACCAVVEGSKATQGKKP